MVWKLWLQIRGNLKYDLLKKLLGALGVSSLLTGAFTFLNHWLSQPASNGTILVFFAASVLMLLIVQAINCRLLVLPARLEWVSQYPDGTGYKRPGRDLALVLPLKNQPRWWHSGLAQEQRLSAHIDFFSEDGLPLESCYHSLWLNERRPDVSIRHGEIKELIVAVQENGRGEIRLPEGGAHPGSEVTDLVSAYRAGAMLSLKALEGHPSIVVQINLSAVGYQRTLLLRMFMGVDFGMEPIEP